jgi:two-component system chemotaxis response regulator CheY
MRAKDNIMESLNKKRPEGLNKLDQSYKVLVVDDSSTMRRIIIQQLKSEAYEICGEASNGEEALQLYKEKDPDIVTLDINMPIMDGIEALKRILEYNKNARIVMLTSEGQKETVIDAISLGAKGYIVKPPNKVKVCESVKKALDG